MTSKRQVRDHACLTLFVPGSYTSLAELAKRLGSGVEIVAGGEALGGEALSFEARLSWEPNPRDGSFGRAFSFGTCTDREVRAIETAGGAVVLELPVDLHSFRSEIAALGQALRSAGALAFRIEQSKLGFAADAWVDRVSAASLYQLAVMTVRDERSARTLGMHVFSFADFEIEIVGHDASRWLDALAMYQLAEDPVFASGHTFTPDAKTPRRVLEWWPDTDYPSGHPCNNPFGVFRLGPPTDRGRPQPKLRMFFIPALRVLLEAAREHKDPRSPPTRSSASATAAIASRWTGVMPVSWSAHAATPTSIQSARRSAGARSSRCALTTLGERPLKQCLWNERRVMFGTCGS